MRLSPHVQVLLIETKTLILGAVDRFDPQLWIDRLRAGPDGEIGARPTCRLRVGAFFKSSGRKKKQSLSPSIRDPQTFTPLLSPRPRA